LCVAPPPTAKGSAPQPGQRRALERELQAKLFASDDAREGLSAFVEKRKAQFSNT